MARHAHLHIICGCSQETTAKSSRQRLCGHRSLNRWLAGLSGNVWPLLLWSFRKKCVRPCPTASLNFLKFSWLLADDSHSLENLFWAFCMPGNMSGPRATAVESHRQILSPELRGQQKSRWDSGRRADGVCEGCNCGKGSKDELRGAAEGKRGNGLPLLQYHRR